MRETFETQERQTIQAIQASSLKADPDFHQDDELSPLHITYYGLLIFNFNPPAGGLTFNYHTKFPLISPPFYNNFRH